jgi:hypothetical protein
MVNYFYGGSDYLSIIPMMESQMSPRSDRIEWQRMPEYIARARALRSAEALCIARAAASWFAGLVRRLVGRERVPAGLRPAGC